MIGIFDSGCGGLTVLKTIRERFPNSDVVYFGDTKNAPYGLKSREELTHLTAAALGVLSERGATHMVSACNSVSASLALSLFDDVEISPDQLVEMVGPTVATFRDSPARILVCATPATIASEIYQHAFAMIGKEVAAIALADVAGAIEQGEDISVIERSIAEAFKDVAVHEYDVLILACTHFPLVTEAFRSVVGDEVLIVDPAHLVADRVERDFAHHAQGNGTTTFLLSAESSPFRQFVSDFFPGGAYTVEVIE